MMYEKQIRELGEQLAHTKVGDRASITYTPESSQVDCVTLECPRADTIEESAAKARIMARGAWSGEIKRRLSKEQMSLLQQAYIEALGLKYFLLYEEVSGPYLYDDAWDMYGQILEELIWRGEGESLDTLREIYRASANLVHAAVAAHRAAAL